MIKRDGTRSGMLSVKEGFGVFASQFSAPTVIGRAHTVKADCKPNKHCKYTILVVFCVNVVFILWVNNEFFLSLLLSFLCHCIDISYK